MHDLHLATATLAKAGAKCAYNNPAPNHAPSVITYGDKTNQIILLKDKFGCNLHTTCFRTTGLGYDADLGECSNIRQTLRSTWALFHLRQPFLSYRNEAWSRAKQDKRQWAIIMMTRSSPAFLHLKRDGCKPGPPLQHCAQT